MELDSELEILTYFCKESNLYVFSDISFLCEAAAANAAVEQQNKQTVPQRTTDKSAIRAKKVEAPVQVCDIMFYID